ncbi:MAG: hypothetical protein DCC51_07085 [Anaerolineae bacterium]|nr:MAG: hypothetical protein DCC51_07085 [Anaerolineae bacterium]
MTGRIAHADDAHGSDDWIARYLRDLLRYYIPGSTKKAKARELALYLWRHSMLPALAETGPAERPDIDWSLLEPYAPLAPKPADNGSAPPATRLDFTDIQKLLDGRNTVLAISGVAPFVNLDLNGSAQQVASSLLVKLNEFGEIAPGDTAIGRLLAFIAADGALPPAHREVIAAVAAKYNLAIG